MAPIPSPAGLQPLAGRTVQQPRHRGAREQKAGGAGELLAAVRLRRRTRPLAGAEDMLAGKSVLSVGDFEDFAASGGMIEFTRMGPRIGVKINIESVTAAHLQVEDRLLKAGQRRRPAEHPP